jgi:hypothetical protein
MFHACIQRFDVTVTMQTFWHFLPTKQGLKLLEFRNQLQEYVAVNRPTPIKKMAENNQTLDHLPW